VIIHQNPVRALIVQNDIEGLIVGINSEPEL
jgi:hypothetical protein